MALVSIRIQEIRETYVDAVVENTTHEVQSFNCHITEPTLMIVTQGETEVTRQAYQPGDYVLLIPNGFVLHENRTGRATDYSISFSG